MIIRHILMFTKGSKSICLDKRDTCMLIVRGYDRVYTTIYIRMFTRKGKVIANDNNR